MQTASLDLSPFNLRFPLGSGGGRIWRRRSEEDGRTVESKLALAGGD